HLPPWLVRRGATMAPAAYARSCRAAVRYARAFTASPALSVSALRAPTLGRTLSPRRPPCRPPGRGGGPPPPASRPAPPPRPCDDTRDGPCRRTAGPPGGPS